MDLFWRLPQMLVIIMTENKLSLRKSFVLIFLDSKLTKILRPIH